MCDVRHPSVCCEYVLLSFLNKEADLAKDQNIDMQILTEIQREGRQNLGVVM